jgi:predicted DsbA family dithiol-disulfide isomerase
MPPLSITVFSDVICPWCYIGKRRLEAAMLEPGLAAPVHLSWHPFELNPDMPAEGIERKIYRARKFGAAHSAQLDAHMLATGREVGIEFAFERMERTPNTRLAHRLIWEAGRQGRQEAAVERLFHGYFEEGLDLGRREVLAGIAERAGLETGGVSRALAEPDSLEAVMSLEQEGYAMGIEGVPFFILSAKYAVAGAQPAEFWRQALPRLAVEAAQGQATA